MTMNPSMISFEILAKEGTILVFDVEDRFPEFSISMDSFWKFVQEYDLNKYCSDSFDPATSSHVQRVGSFDYDEYFDLDYSSIKKDLELYLVRKKIISLNLKLKS